MLDIVEAVDGTQPAFRCTEIRRRGPAAVAPSEYRLPCGIHRAMVRADEAWRAELRATTIAEPARRSCRRRVTRGAGQRRPLVAGRDSRAERAEGRTDMATVFVTGATGVLGRGTVERLVEARPSRARASRATRNARR